MCVKNTYLQVTMGLSLLSLSHGRRENTHNKKCRMSSSRRRKSPPAPAPAPASPSALER